MTDLNKTDLEEIRDAVPGLDLHSIRALRRAGFDIVRHDEEIEAPIRPAAGMIPRPMRSTVFEAAE
ncbi:MAG: hypothetical protein INR65_10560 [Gluconacetobacter diazotrophicus]|nr:hypothetical protein [Gluconacetobacter diazotrophicus]